MFFEIRLKGVVVLVLVSVFVQAQENIPARSAGDKSTTKSNKKPNIIFILTDDQRWD